jgi:transposase
MRSGQEFWYCLENQRTKVGERRITSSLEGVLYVARMSCPWRDLPKELGNWYSVYVRCARLETYGVWRRVAEALQGEADLEELLIDATVVPPALSAVTS